MVSNFQAAVKQMFLYSHELFMKNKLSNVFFSVFLFLFSFFFLVMLFLLYFKKDFKSILVNM